MSTENIVKTPAQEVSERILTLSKNRQTFTLDELKSWTEGFSVSDLEELNNAYPSNSREVRFSLRDTCKHDEKAWCRACSDFVCRGGEMSDDMDAPKLESIRELYLANKANLATFEEFKEWLLETHSHFVLLEIKKRIQTCEELIEYYESVRVEGELDAAEAKLEFNKELDVLTPLLKKLGSEELAAKAQSVVQKFNDLLSVHVVTCRCGRNMPPGDGCYGSDSSPRYAFIEQMGGKITPKFTCCKMCRDRFFCVKWRDWVMLSKEEQKLFLAEAKPRKTFNEPLVLFLWD